MSIFKKILFRDSYPNEILSNGSFSALKPELQERLSNGVKYNLKLVIRGERKTGKSSLLSRLKGEEFSSNYTPTDEINVACILWNYQPTNDTVKVDVWDVVDKGRQREVKHGAIAPGYVSQFTSKNRTTKALASLDSTFIDVYKGANCVILIFDITNKLTFEYVRRELLRVPHSVPVLVVGNYRDIAAGGNLGGREMSESDARAFIRRATEARQAASAGVTPSDNINISDIRNMYKCAPIRYCETSMRNGFGLMYIYKFLNIPFLHLQCSNLIEALVANRQAFSNISQQLDSAEENQEAICSYDKFTSWLESTRGPIVSQTCQVNQSLSTTSPVESKALKIPSSEGLMVDKNEHAPELALPSNPVEVKPFRDFLNRSDKPLPPIISKGDLNGGGVETIESPVNAVPLVAAFQEDPDPDDTAVHMAALSLGLNGSIASPHQSPVFPPLAYSMEEEDDDDDDLMNEDSDDDEEHLGPALGLTSISSANDDDQLQLFQIPSFRTSTASPSPTSSKRASPGIDSTSLPPAVQISSGDPVDLATAEERSAFERFLDDI